MGIKGGKKWRALSWAVSYTIFLNNLDKLVDVIFIKLAYKMELEENHS